jgi:predicted nucleotidyltransferase
MTVDPLAGPRDQDHVVLDDGIIVSVHGAVHPAGHLIGEVVYVPDPDGSHCLFGRRYRKAYQRDGRGIAEQKRLRIRDRTDSYFDRAHMFDGKSIVHRGRVRRYVACADLFTDESPDNGQKEAARSLWESACRILGITGASLQVTLTGSLNLDPHPRHVRNPNDLDLLFTGSTATVGRLVAAMSAAAHEHPKIRVHEYGKGWRIRMRTAEGLLCSFFRYGDATEIPLCDVTDVRTVRNDVEIHGTVASADHNVFMPMILEVEVEVTNAPETVPLESRLPIVIYHLRSRGDFFQGDRGRFRGTVVEITEGLKAYLALSVVDGTSSHLLTPPWLPY